MSCLDAHNLEGTSRSCVAVSLLGATHAEGTSAWLHPLNRRETRRIARGEATPTRSVSDRRYASRCLDALNLEETSRTSVAS
jgi:hypothetical protein